MNATEIHGLSLLVLLNVHSPIYPQPDDVVEHPHIRTFHARHGRMSTSRELTLANLLPNFEISDLDRPIDLRAIIGQEFVVIDFGSGMGSHSLTLAGIDPQVGVLAIDVHTVGLIAVAEAATERDMTNLRTHHGDGIDVFKSWLTPESIQEVHILFPDPWPKARHHKRRLITTSFLNLSFRLLKPGGKIIFATDDESYFASALEVFDEFSELTITLNDWTVPLTSYHQRALRLGHTVSQLSATKLISG